MVDIAVVVNLRARRGTESVAQHIHRSLPRARVLASRSVEETRDFARDVLAGPPALLVSAGGDGTAIALMNAVREEAWQRGPFALGVLPLGTGNAWARATGARDWRSAARKLESAAFRRAPLPLRRFDLLEIEGNLAHFAGTGWDAELIDDFHAQKTGIGLLPRSMRKGLAGYMHGLFTRMIPRNLALGPAEVEVVNTGDPALGVDDEGRPFEIPGGGKGAVLYRGPTTVCGAGTSSEWGFGFRAYPFAGLVPRRFNFRVYAGRTVRATLSMGKLWRGEHPLPHMHSFLLTRCRASFSRPVPFQIGGDRVGLRTEIEYGLAPEQVDVLDWKSLPAQA